MRLLLIVGLALGLGACDLDAAEPARPGPGDIQEFVADPFKPDYFKDFRITRPDLEKVLREYSEVDEHRWRHGYSHVGEGMRTGHVTLRDGRKIGWMVKPGGLAWLEFSDGKKMYLAAEPTRSVADLNAQIERFNQERPGAKGISPIERRVARVERSEKEGIVHCFDEKGVEFLTLRRQDNGRFRGVIETPFHEPADRDPHRWGHVQAEFFLPNDAFVDAPLPSHSEAALELTLSVPPPVVAGRPSPAVLKIKNVSTAAVNLPWPKWIDQFVTSEIKGEDGTTRTVKHQGLSLGHGKYPGGDLKPGATSTVELPLTFPTKGSAEVRCILEPSRKACPWWSFWEGRVDSNTVKVDVTQPGPVKLAVAAPPGKPKASPGEELLKDYHGDVVLPPELRRTYTDLIVAFQTGKQQEIETFCLPGKIKFTAEPRSKEGRNYGQDINLPFLKDGFHKFIQYLRKDSDTDYLIRTNSTAFWFTKSQDGEWRLSKYLDKPIE